MKEEVKNIVTISNQKLWFSTTMMLIILQISNNIGVAAGSQRVPAMFVFGDSLVDVGNNNFLSSVAKANYFPYGCDFKSGPTGRFTNGETIVDMLGNKLTSISRVRFRVYVAVPAKNTNPFFSPLGIYFFEVLERIIIYSS